MLTVIIKNKTRILHFEQQLLHVSQIVSCLHVSAYFIGVKHVRIQDTRDVYLYART